MASGSDAIAPADRELIERLAGRVVELRLDVPAVVTLETSKPLSLLAGQTLTFFEPMVQAMFNFPDYRRFAALIERREVLEALTEAIERRAEEARIARRQRSARPSTPEPPAPGGGGGASPNRRAPRG